MLASILDRLLQSNSEIKKNETQRVDGHKLPEFEKISHYLQPSGLVMRSTEKGWEFGSLLLAPLKPNEDFASPSTRVSNTDAESGSNR